MILAYIHRRLDDEKAHLCLLADKPDTYSIPITVGSLNDTHGGVMRVGPFESIHVSTLDEESAKLIRPIVPTKVFLTPSLPDLPGTEVRYLKFVPRPDGDFDTFYQQDKDIRSGEWKQWDPSRAVAGK